MSGRKEQYTIDKSQWVEGPWSSEPDVILWVDQETGLTCKILRHETLGHLCGYVGVPADHTCYGKAYDDCYVDVHGGLTFSQCVKDQHNSEGLWWLGFDCAHSWDITPERVKNRYYAEDFATYKDIKYVTSEVNKLAEQLNLMGYKSSEPA